MHLAGMNRYQAFGIHFGISLMIFIGLVTMVLFVWYPGVLREVDSSWQQALIMIAGVDLVLGPLLTLIVFNPAKKSLKMDLSIIAIAQIAALIAGTYTVHQARPVALYVSFPAEGFEILTANNLAPKTESYLIENGSLFFYYTGKELFGPSNQKDLQPDQLIPTSEGDFNSYLSTKMPQSLFLFEKTLSIDIPAANAKAIFDLEGNYKRLEDQTSQ
ncbi:MAG: hypothetical protein CMI09_07140 [Oceanospirillaceae bacterium]|nr:hypothetical protein [Oceanospirillaceae bacterium]|tara:strand:- start:548 stop:1195 length:648 start_codon:yes stop_codon:yes gene_type:complete